MSNVVRFPKVGRVMPPVRQEPSHPEPARASMSPPRAEGPQVVTPKKGTGPATATPARATRFLAGLVKFLWVVLALTWPVLKWLVSLDVVFQFARMAWFWGEPGKFAGTTFALHFAAFVALTYFVSHYKPKGL